MTSASIRTAESPETACIQAARLPEAPGRAHRKEAILRALSGLDAMKRQADPDVAQQVIAHQYQVQTTGAALPPLIADFLDSPWRSYMAQLYMAVGDRSTAWRSALENTELLTWSVQPKRDEESRERFYEVLPELFEWIHAVLESQQVSVPDEDAFFTALSRLHSACLRPNGEQVSGSAPVSAPGGKEEARASEGPAGARDGDGGNGAGHYNNAAEPELAAVSSQADRTRNVANEEANPLSRLVVGAWVEFHSERGTKRTLRLEWISGSKGAYLFRDEKRGDALCLTVDRFLEYLHKRSAILLS